MCILITFLLYIGAQKNTTEIIFFFFKIRKSRYNFRKSYLPFTSQGRILPLTFYSGLLKSQFFSHNHHVKIRFNRLFMDNCCDIAKSILCLTVHTSAARNAGAAFSILNLIHWCRDVSNPFPRGGFISDNFVDACHYDDSPRWHPEQTHRWSDNPQGYPAPALW